MDTHWAVKVQQFPDGVASCVSDTEETQSAFFQGNGYRMQKCEFL